MRSKEEAHDYRYFPDPDLLPLEIDQSFVDNIKKNYLNFLTKKKIGLLKNLNYHPTRQMF